MELKAFMSPPSTDTTSSPAVRRKLCTHTSREAPFNLSLFAEGSITMSCLLTWTNPGPATCLTSFGVTSNPARGESEWGVMIQQGDENALHTILSLVGLTTRTMNPLGKRDKTKRQKYRRTPLKDHLCNGTTLVIGPPQ